MRVAFLHYHLKTGGVTSVIKQQVAALNESCEILVLTGNPASTLLPCQVVEISGLDYGPTDTPPVRPKVIAQQILKTLADIWPAGCDVLHIHNPTLAKNRTLLPCIQLLQSSGIKLFLQIHDFAEDGRPYAYSREAYPSDCHYGVINVRDAEVLQLAGLSPSGVHLLPNAIQPLPVVKKTFSERFVLYPVRAIRRKNIGEALLLSLYLKPGRFLYVTQPPNSPTDIKSYLDWRSFVKNHGLNVRFDMGKKHDFLALAGAASTMITTSITEGFGFSFLEPWTAKKMLWGRRLGAICRDFEANGLCLGTLYDRVEIPLDWFDSKGFLEAWCAAALQADEIFGYVKPPGEVRQLAQSMIHKGVVDFGVLNETYQRQVLEYLITHPDARQDLAWMTPQLTAPAQDKEMIEHNHQVVRRHYDPKKYAGRLLAVYQKVVKNSVCHRIDKPSLLDAFFDLNHFSLLKWGPYGT